MTFWILAGALATAIGLLLVIALLRGRNTSDGMDALDITIYRDQLASVERDVARGTVTEEEAERLRTEIKRRILDADRAHADDREPGQAPRLPSLIMASLALVGVVGGSLALYNVLGAPAYPDLPLAARLEAAAEARANRPSQTEAAASVPPLQTGEISAEYAELMEQLRTAVAERPDDLRGHVLLTRNEANLGNFSAAAEAQTQVIRLRGDDVTARDYADYGDLLVLAAGGYVSPEAEAAFAQALALDPTNGTARFYMGSMHLQTGRPDLAFRIWEAQLREGPADAPWIAPIRAQILDVAARAGVDYSLPPEGEASPGPSAADVAAAQDMTPSERMAMIEGMVTGLSERLATEGGPPEEWARLIRAYGVLGNRMAAAAVWAEAQEVFPDQVAIIPILRAARDAGVAQ